MTDANGEEDLTITLLEFEDEKDLQTALLFFDDIPFSVGDEHEKEDVEEILEWLMEAQVNLVIVGHYLQLEGPSTFLGHQTTAMARQIWLCAMRIASMTPDLKEAQRNNDNGLA
jgi:hypothetical protein